jgi:ABC-2 type transport system ATP-binding protein
MIEVENLCKWYGPTLAVDRLSFAIPAGQIVGFLGPNGAGKSTTLRILTGYMPATSGTVRVAGHDVFTDSLAVRSKIGYLPENTPLYPEMRVEEYLHYRGRLHGMDHAARRQRIDRVCDLCGLAAVRRRLIGQLSRGNRQRVGLAQALLHDPPVLILDEPTASLDPNQITHVRQLIQDLRDKHTIILSTHILPEVEKTAGRLLVIASGKIVAEGTPDELRQRVASQSRILLEVKAPPAAAEKALRQVSGAVKVDLSSHDGWCRATVTPQDGHDIREALGAIVTANRWPIREMRHETASLEQFFVQITAQQSQAATPTQAA